MSLSIGARGRAVLLSAGIIVVIAGIGASPFNARQAGQVRSAQGYITGVVQSSQGREAGVWVIAETRDLLTNFIKIVVTDDQGRFMAPDLPDGNYSVWVRGYGLADSTPVRMKPSANQVTL